MHLYIIIENQVFEGPQIQGSHLSNWYKPRYKQWHHDYVGRPIFVWALPIFIFDSKWK